MMLNSVSDSAQHESFSGFRVSKTKTCPTSLCRQDSNSCGQGDTACAQELSKDDSSRNLMAARSSSMTLQPASSYAPRMPPPQLTKICRVALVTEQTLSTFLVAEAAAKPRVEGVEDNFSRFAGRRDAATSERARPDNASRSSAPTSVQPMNTLSVDDEQVVYLFDLFSRRGIYLGPQFRTKYEVAKLRLANSNQDGQLYENL